MYSEDEITKYVEPVFRFCLARLGRRCDAEDLAGEIMLHIVDGFSKYEIASLDAWVWRIAHNRYARFVDARRRCPEFSSDSLPERAEEDDYTEVDGGAAGGRYALVFRCLHTLSAAYRDIMVDYYLYDMPVSELAAKYSLGEAAVKWRLNAGREKIRKRIGERTMDKIYKRINWNTTTCNGSMDPDRYLRTQLARAICEAAYERPLTVEEISIKTGLPAMYIEDELPRLIYGDAVLKLGGKYAANFIVLRLCDKKVLDTCLAPAVGEVADYFERLLSERAGSVDSIGFWGNTRGVGSLGYIIIPAVLRGKIADIKKRLGYVNGGYPPRKDGGYGWFLVEETEDALERVGIYNSGCNIADGDDPIYYFHVAKYFDSNLYHNGGTLWLSAEKLVGRSEDGVIPEGLLADEDKARLLRLCLIEKQNGRFVLNFPVFGAEEYHSFINPFDSDSEGVEKLLADLIESVHEAFRAFVPPRLGSQVNQWVSCYSHSIIGYVTEELIRRGALREPGAEKPLVDGIFCVRGNHIDV